MGWYEWQQQQLLRHILHSGDKMLLRQHVFLTFLGHCDAAAVNLVCTKCDLQIVTRTLCIARPERGCRCEFRPVKHHLHVVPHVRVPVLIDGKAEDDDADDDDGGGGDCGRDGHINLVVVGGDDDDSMSRIWKPYKGVEELDVNVDDFSDDTRI